MIRKWYPGLLFLAGVAFGLIASNRWIVRAQDQRGAARSAPSGSASEGVAREPGRAIKPDGVDGLPAIPPATERSPGAPTVQDVLVRPYRFPFSRPTSLLEACAHLKQTLKVPVVLDIAALGRQDVDPEDTVQLELDGARLKTGLKLLLDQVGLTYHVATEDNLLIITDREGSDDPLDRVWTELRAMHRELHDVQDAIEDLTDGLAVDQGEGPRVRKPTIIEEMPEDELPKAEVPRAKPEEPVRKPKGLEGPAPAPRPTPARVPLLGPGRPL